MMTGMTETRWSVLSALPPLLSVWEHHRVGSGATLCWEVPFKRAWLCPGARAPSCSWGLVQVQSLPYLGSDKTVVQAGWVSGLTYLTFQHPTPSFWHFLSCCKLWGCLWPPYWSAQRPAQPSFFMRKCVNLPRHPSPFLIGDKEVVKIPPANAGDVKTRLRSLGWEDPLEKGVATHSNVLAWRIPQTEEPGGL